MSDGEPAAKPAADGAEPAADLASKLQRARLELLDLSGRNRLVVVPKGQRGLLQVVDERSEEIYRILVAEAKSMSFLPRQEDGQGEGKTDGLRQPDEDLEVVDDDSTVAERHKDRQLQTALESEALQSRLLTLYYDARTFEEEQGANILFLVLGTLRWFEEDKSDVERRSPLILLPVTLERQTAASRFTIRVRDEDISTNLSLKERLQQDFGVVLPDVREADELKPSEYFAEVRRAVANQTRWRVVENDVLLGFFSFAKLLMYRDLDSGNWPRQSLANGLVAGLLGGGIPRSGTALPDDKNLDDLLDPKDLVHVLDADSSQTVAIEEVKSGRNLVIQGPPGTGKSQTIANIIASAVKNRKRVLFLAEKMAALEVVKRRLEAVDLGDMCLELHSHKASKTSVLAELAATLELGRPRCEGIEAQRDELVLARDSLNTHCRRLHTAMSPSSMTPFDLFGRMGALRARGVQPTPIRMDESVVWDEKTFRAKEELVKDLTAHQREVGVPARHAWRGVRAGNLLPTDVDRVLSEIASLSNRVTSALDMARELIAALGLSTCDLSSSQLKQVCDQASLVSRVPRVGREALANGIWIEAPDEVAALARKVRELADVRRDLDAVVSHAAWLVDVAPLRAALAAHGRSFFRFLSGAYRKAQATLCSILAGAPPRSLDARLAIVDGLLRGRSLRAAMVDEGAKTTGRQSFGAAWRSEESNSDEISALAEWDAEARRLGVPPPARSVAACCADPQAIGSLAGRLRNEVDAAQVELGRISDALDLDTQAAFGAAADSIPLDGLARRLSEWLSSRDGLSVWAAFFYRLQRVRAEVSPTIADAVYSGSILIGQAVDAFEMAYCEALLREAGKRHPELLQFNGVTHDRVLQSFRRLDSDRKVLARHEVAAEHWANLPSGDAEAGEMAIVRQEINKKRRHKPLRRLLAEAGRVVQRIKPVFMMSPLSVAQFLEPGRLEFDLLLIDEASQVRPVDALGAIARARQIVVVGDDKQLPPTRFFSKVLDDSEEEEGSPTADLDSILDLCRAQNVPSRMLSWHYRSRHHSLIAVSNREFYGGKLFVMPSPEPGGAEYGVVFSHVTGGTYDRGGSATNRAEAEAVCRAIVGFAREFPDKSLGVGTFSVAQRDAILDELELLRRANPDLEPFFASSRAEPFFVKNLENIQGDERDVIVISVGYGRDAAGKMSANFGPLSADGGERRLNVLITRARDRCEVFSSITDEDIDLRGSQARGARVLQTFLKYARTGTMDVSLPTGRGYDSEFERQVADALQSKGFEVDAQVGASGFRIDLAIRDPELPGRYVLGVECDGLQYHRSRWARDRDRLRQRVLEDRGWIIHRIWSTDWFQRSEEQIDKLVKAIQNAKAIWASRTQPGAEIGDRTPVESAQQAAIDREAKPSGARTTGGRAASPDAEPYREATFSVHRTVPIHETPPAQLDEVVFRIVQIEGPIHRDEVTRRGSALWGVQRTGNRIACAVATALTRLLRAGRIEREDAFFQVPGAIISVRSRISVEAAGLRRPENLPPSELREAVARVVRRNPGCVMEDACRQVARLIGFKSTSGALAFLIAKEAERLVAAGVATMQDGKLYSSDVSG